MRRVIFLTVLIFLTLGSELFAQERIRIAVPSTANKLLISQGYDLDHGSSAKVSYVYADRRLLRKLDTQGISYTMAREKTSRVKMVALREWLEEKNDRCSVPLHGYPTYPLYERLMRDFAESHPDIAKLHVLGTLGSGRRILALEIGDHPNREEDEPKILLSSSMHGDELAGYHLSLRLIDYLLCNYGSDADLTELVNETEIWINPLANPDGAYWETDLDVNAARRFNRNGVDLNRNFPDPDDGEHPDGNPYQAETQIFMALAQKVPFDLALNIHGGAEVFNYPWDTWSGRHADTDWWRYVAREFAAGCQSAAGHDGFFTDLENGITNGYEWYPVAGGRQDFTNYYHRTREATLEVSQEKLVPETKFDELWNRVRDPIIGYFQQSRFGLRGTVRDSLTGQPIEASVTIPGYDELHSDVTTRLPTGRYHRFLKANHYELVFHAPGYHPRVVEYQIEDRTVNYLDVALLPDMGTSHHSADLQKAPVLAIYEGESLQLQNLPIALPGQWLLELFSADGRRLLSRRSEVGQDRYRFHVGNLTDGEYYCRVSGKVGQRTIPFAVVRKK